MMLLRKLATIVVACAFVLAGTSACKKAESEVVPVAAVASDTAAVASTQGSAPTAEELAAAAAVQDIFGNADDTAVTAGASGPTFPLVEPMKVTVVVTMHVGANVPAGSIALKDATGKTWGPWAAQVSDAPDGNTYWSCVPNAALPIGEYTVVDSDPRTWAKNEGSDGFGFVSVQGVVE